jgi:putative transcription factor
MYDCEICGKHTETLYIIDVEGAQLSVCASCSRGKDVVDEIGTQTKVRGSRVVGKRQPAEEEEELVDGYGLRIRKAREAMGIDIKVLGEMINEKHSTLLRVEEEKMPPNMDLTAKLEKALGIKLTEKPEPLEAGETPKKGPITLGDAAFKKDKKGE